MTPDLTPDGWDRLDEMGAVAALHYSDGTIRIRHHCDRSQMADDGRSSSPVVCAPALRLGNGHEVISLAPLTISPSVLCRDCGLHGFIRNGAWESA
jgi:hypothetical protein